MFLLDIYQIGENPELSQEYKFIFESLKQRLPYNNGRFIFDKIFESLQTYTSYARKTYIGRLKSSIKLTELELAMVLDNGYAHFGGESILNKDGSFKVVIYTD